MKGIVEGTRAARIVDARVWLLHIQGLLAFAVQVGASVLCHHLPSEGEAVNGFLETHVFVIARSHEP